MTRTASTLAAIDALQRISAMREALTRLPEDERKAVILLALRESRFQATWSFFASTFAIPESEWPNPSRPNDPHRGAAP